MSELVINAIEASTPNQDVVVLVSETGDGDLLWQVQDDGVGMSELELDAAGESAADNTLWSGIVRARSVVEAHGGLIHFESTPTFGTTASIWLPRMGRGASSATEPPAHDSDDEDFVLDSVRSEPRSGRPVTPRVLVVDDDPLLRQTFARILASYDVTLSSNGHEALTLALSRSFDAIVSDLMMPGMTGMQLFAALQEQAPDQAARICFVTGGGATTEGFLASVANPRLYKPFESAQLLAAVGQLATLEHPPCDRLNTIARPPNRFR